MGIVDPKKPTRNINGIKVNSNFKSNNQKNYYGICSVSSPKVKENY